MLELLLQHIKKMQTLSTKLPLGNSTILCCMRRQYVGLGHALHGDPYVSSLSPQWLVDNTSGKNDFSEMKRDVEISPHCFSCKLVCFLATTVQ